jgi:hypothetical protein
MRRELLFSLIVMSLTASPALSSSFAGATRENPLVCKRDRDTTLGSHFRAPRTCMLRSAWHELEMRTQNELQQIMDGQAANRSGGNGGVQALTRRPL